MQLKVAPGNAGRSLSLLDPMYASTAHPTILRPTKVDMQLKVAPGNAGRSLSLLDPTYASKYIPIIASVSEHQPPAWPSYFTDLHVASVLMPAGLISLFWPLTAASMFLILYACTAVYFSGVMVRSCCLLLCPVASGPSWHSHAPHAPARIPCQHNAHPACPCQCHRSAWLNEESMATHSSA